MDEAAAMAGPMNVHIVCVFEMPLSKLMSFSSLFTDGHDRYLVGFMLKLFRSKVIHRGLSGGEFFPRGMLLGKFFLSVCRSLLK